MSDNILSRFGGLFRDINIDITKIVEYEKLKRELTHIDNISGPMYMQNLNSAHDMCSLIVAEIQYKYEQALSIRKMEEAKAKLERAGQYFEEKGILGGSIKDSASLRDAYVNMDKIYLDARERENALKALLTYFEKKVESFRMAHDDAKKIYDKIASGPYGNSGYGGMSSDKDTE